jgi:hypothetical protein
MSLRRTLNVNRTRLNKDCSPELRSFVSLFPFLRRYPAIFGHPYRDHSAFLLLRAQQVRTKRRRDRDWIGESSDRKLIQLTRELAYRSISQSRKVHSRKPSPVFLERFARVRIFEASAIANLRKITCMGRNS